MNARKIVAKRRTPKRPAVCKRRKKICKQGKEEDEIELLAEYRPKSPPITDDRYLDLRSPGQLDIARKLDAVISRLEQTLVSSDSAIQTDWNALGWNIQTAVKEVLQHF